MAEQRPPETRLSRSLASLALIAAMAVAASGFGKSLSATIDPERVLVTPSDLAKTPVAVYTEQRTDSRKLGSLSKGQTADFLGDLGEWYQVQLGNGAHGVVRKWVTMTISSRSRRQVSSHFRPLRGPYPLFLSSIALAVLLPMAVVRFNLLGSLSRPKESAGVPDSIPMTVEKSDGFSHPNLAPRLPAFSPGYDGVLGEIRKRAQMTQVARTMDSQIALNEKHLAALGQIRRLEEDKLAIVNLRYTQQRACLENQDQTEEINVRAVEREARIAQAKLAKTKVEREAAAILNPPPPPRPSGLAARARTQAKRHRERIQFHLELLKQLDDWEAKELAKASPLQAGFIKEMFRRMKDKEREGID